MPDKKEKNDQLEYSGEQNTSVLEVNRRGSGRHLFMAEAEVYSPNSGVRFLTRITDLGLGGCFVDTLTPFPVGAEVHVSIKQGKTHVDTKGEVVYSQAGLGMGVAFRQLAPEQQTALVVWLADVATSQLPVPEAQRKPKDRMREPHEDHGALVRLVQVMVKKGILTPSDASSILEDLPIA